MVKKLHFSDFRAVRRVLEPDDFALGPAHEPAPSDLIDAETWHSIQTLPGDVAIRTAAHYGTVLAEFQKTADAWLDLGPDSAPTTELAEAGMGLYEEGTAAVFFMLHGYYRQAVAGLRAGLDYVADAMLSATGAAAPAVRKFGPACDHLSMEVRRRWVGISRSDDPYAQKDGTGNFPPGWMRDLYWRLSQYSHARPGHANWDLWESNGPILSDDAFMLCAQLFREAHASAWVTLRICGANHPALQPTVTPSDPWNRIYSDWLGRLGF